MAKYVTDGGQHVPIELHMNYMQFSKKLAVAAMASWFVAYVAAMVGMFLLPIDSIRADLLRTILAYNATLTGTIIVGYMGNSSVEKYARYKFDYESCANTQPLTNSGINDNTQILG